MKVSLFDRGYCLERPRMLGSKKRKRGGGKRGKLTGKVSSASFRRLRAWCIEHDCSLREAWGITLTVPGLDLISVSDFKSLHHKLCVYCNDHQYPLVWRVELQQRRQPHLHCVLFANSVSAMHIVAEWYRLLSTSKVFNVEQVGDCKDVVLIPRSFVNGSVHAADLQKLSGDFRAWRYLVSHMSKAKQVQLGWTGRNWGVCNRRLFTNSNPVELYPSDRVSVCLIRFVRRLYIGAKPWILLSGKKEHNRYIRKFRVSGKRYMLGDPALIRRMYDFLVERDRVSYSTLSTCPEYAESVVRNLVTCRMYWLYSWFGLQFLSSLPHRVFEVVYSSTKSDCQKLEEEVFLFVLRVRLWYDDLPF